MFLRIITKCALIIALFTAGFASAMMSSDVPQGNVSIKNALWGATSTPTIQATYIVKEKTLTRKGKPRTRKLESTRKIAYDQTLTLGPLKNLSQDSEIIIEGYGKKQAAYVSQLSISRDELIQEWQNLDSSLQGDLLVTIKWQSPTSWRSTEIYAEYSIQGRPKEIKKKISDNPLDEFPQIKAWGLHQMISADDILDAKSSTDVVLWGIGGVGKTTAEDTYRYILGLGKGYKKNDVVLSYRDLYRQWNPDNFPEASDEKLEVVNTINQLINRSKDGLLEALKQKERAEEG